jgi:4'-phosphopantetheinyl transferase EntD
MPDLVIGSLTHKPDTALAVDTGDVLDTVDRLR